MRSPAARAVASENCMMPRGPAGLVACGVAPAFQIRDRRDQRNGPATLVSRAAKDGRQARAGDSFRASHSLRIPHDGESLRLNHAVGAGGQQLGVMRGPASADAQELMLRREIFDGGDQQAAGKERREQSNGAEIAR